MLNEALRLLRVYHDFSQTDLADKLSISKSYLSEIESGKKTTSLVILNKYSDIFNIPVSSLLLFSETLENNSFPERLRVKAGKKVLNLLNWVAAKQIA